MKPHVNEMLGYDGSQSTDTNNRDDLVMHDYSHHVQAEYRCAAIEKALGCRHRRFFILLIRVLAKVSAGNMLSTRLRFQQRAFLDDRAAAERPYSCRVPALRENDTRVVNTCERFVQKLKERLLISIIGCRERDPPLRKGMGMDINNGIDIVPAVQFSQRLVDEILFDA